MPVWIDETRDDDAAIEIDMDSIGNTGVAAPGVEDRSIVDEHPVGQCSRAGDRPDNTIVVEFLCHRCAPTPVPTALK